MSSDFDALLGGYLSSDDEKRRQHEAKREAARRHDEIAKAQAPEKIQEFIAAMRQHGVPPVNLYRDPKPQASHFGGNYKRLEPTGLSGWFAYFLLIGRDVEDGPWVFSFILTDGRVVEAAHGKTKRMSEYAAVYVDEWRHGWTHFADDSRMAHLAWQIISKAKQG